MPRKVVNIRNSRSPSDMCQSLHTTQLLLVLLASYTVSSTVPTRHDRVTAIGSMNTDEIKKGNLLNVLSAIFDWKSPEDDTVMINVEDPELPYRPQRSMYNPHMGSDKSMCKNFFWKTFSAC
ncbi:cortistatin [Dendropsophus ebraccatus]|uniref:cortistatin n=1 Tax=Dendropsophus ebraccatus TaxID=150705 RepID=UPI003831613F